MQVVAFSLLGATDGENVLKSKELRNFAGLWGGFPAVPVVSKIFQILKVEHLSVSATSSTEASKLIGSDSTSTCSVWS